MRAHQSPLHRRTRMRIGDLGLVALLLLLGAAGLTYRLIVLVEDAAIGTAVSLTVLLPLIASSGGRSRR